VLVADALAFAGLYCEALIAFGNCLDRTSNDPGDAAWRLKERALTHICRLVGEKQCRDPEQATSLVEQLDLNNTDLDIETAAAALGAAIAHDGLCASAHYMHALLSVESDGSGSFNLSKAIDPAICAAVFAPEEPDFWTFAIVVAASNGEADTLIYDLLRVGIFKCGTILTTALLALDPPLGTEHSRLLAEATQDVSRERSQATAVLRSRESDGKVQVLQMDLRAPNQETPAG
jgi:hypothetical protein